MRCRINSLDFYVYPRAIAPRPHVRLLMQRSRPEIMNLRCRFSALRDAKRVFMPGLAGPFAWRGRIGCPFPPVPTVRFGSPPNNEN
jgi:hypothetical protein